METTLPNRFALVLAVVACALVATFSIGVRAATASQRLVSAKFVKALAPAHGGGVYFIAERADGGGMRTFRFANLTGKVQTVSLPGFKIGTSNPTAAGVGAGGRVWLAATRVGKGRANYVFRQKSPVAFSAIRLPAGQSVKGFSAGTNGRTFLIGVGSRGVRAIDKTGRIRTVTGTGAFPAPENALSSSDGALWTLDGTRLRRFAKGKLTASIKLDRTPSKPELFATGSSVWIPAKSGILHVLKDGSATFLALKYPTLPGTEVDHPRYTYARSVFGLYRASEGVGFVAGSPYTSELDNGIGFTSLGSVSNSGIVTESEPLENGFGLGDDSASGGVGKLAVKDVRGTLWVATVSGLYGSSADVANP